MKWVDRIGIHHLTSKKHGALAIVQDILTFQYMVTYESFIKKWSPMYITHHPPLNPHLLAFPLIPSSRTLSENDASYGPTCRSSPIQNLNQSEAQTDFDISNHVFCVEESMTMKEIAKYCQQQLMVRSFMIKMRLVFIRSFIGTSQ